MLSILRLLDELINLATNSHQDTFAPGVCETNNVSRVNQTGNSFHSGDTSDDIMSGLTEGEQRSSNETSVRDDSDTCWTDCGALVMGGQNLLNEMESVKLNVNSTSAANNDEQSSECYRENPPGVEEYRLLHGSCEDLDLTLKCNGTSTSMQQSKTNCSGDTEWQCDNVEAEYSLPKLTGQVHSMALSDIAGKATCKEKGYNDRVTEHRVFVGNISYRVNKEQLSEFFSKFGTVNFCQIVTERAKNRSKGYGFVSFVSIEDRKRALEASADDLILDGRVVRVHPAEQKRRITAHREMLWTPQDTCSHSVSLPLQPSGNECFIDKLPEDCLRLIFVKLPFKQRIIIERVCKLWRRVAMSTWSSLETLHFRGFFNHFGGLTDKMLLSILSHRGCRNLKNLDVSHSSRLLTDWSVDVIAKNCPHIRCLNLSNVMVTNMSLKTLGKMCPELERITLKACLDVGEKGLWWLFHKCKLLKYLDLSHLKKLSGKCFHMLGPHVICALVNETEIIDEGLSLLCNRSSGLVELQINECLRITSRGLAALNQVIGRSLSVLHAEYLPSVATDGWETLKHLPNLTELHLRRNPGVTDEVLAIVGKHCHLLRKLDISACSSSITDEGVTYLASCSLLQVLKISYLDKVNDGCLSPISMSCPLEVLEMRGCALVTDIGLADLAIHCITLQEIDVSSCHRVTERAVENFVSSRLLQGAGHPLEVVVGGTCIESCDEDRLSQANIKLNYSDLCVYEYKPRDCLHFQDWYADDSDDEDHISQNLQLDDMEEMWNAAGNEEQYADWSESYNRSFDWQEAWLEAGDPVFEEYWNPS